MHESILMHPEYQQKLQISHIGYNPGQLHSRCELGNQSESAAKATPQTVREITSAQLSIMSCNVGSPYLLLLALKVNLLAQFLGCA